VILAKKFSTPILSLSQGKERLSLKFPKNSQSTPCRPIQLYHFSFSMPPYRQQEYKQEIPNLHLWALNEAIGVLGQSNKGMNGGDAWGSFVNGERELWEGGAEIKGCVKGYELGVGVPFWEKNFSPKVLQQANFVSPLRSLRK
jgi:hypothetical protein